MSELFLCPQCGSPSVEFSSLTGGAASCKACGWRGTTEDMASIPAEVPGVLEQERMTREFYRSVREVFRDAAAKLVPVLGKWGFLDLVATKDGVRVRDPAQAVRYVNASVQGAVHAIIELRAQLEKERVNGAN